LFLPWFEKCRCASSCWCVSTSLIYAFIDEFAFQVIVHWHHALPEAIWMGTYLHGWTPQKCSQCFSDTYDVYYDNPGLIPQLHWPPMEAGESTPRTLDKDRGDATVEDICDFIVEYINSDVMVCFRLCLVLVFSGSSLRSTGPPVGPAHRNCRSIKGGTLFVYALTASSPIDRTAYLTIGA
jgi:hypothetical protein